MIWDDDFIEFLKKTKSKGGRNIEHQAPKVYDPIFRLQIGSGIIIGPHMGSQESEANPKVLEISTHPRSCSQSTTSEVMYHGMVAGKYPFLYGVGLTDSISMGAQSVNPRTFQYTGATLSVGVTEWAASCATQLLIGTLARLQVAFPTMDTKDYNDVQPRFYNIFIGVYKGMKWNGQQHTLEFGDGLEAARYHYTYNAAYTPGTFDPDQGKWFPGCGTQTTTTSTMSDFSDVDVVLETDFAASSVTRWGYTKKLKNSWNSIVYGKNAYGGDVMPAWALVVNTSSKHTWIAYKTSGNDTATSKLELREAYSTVAWDHPLPGYSGLSGEQRVIDGHGGIGSGSTVTNVCVLSGTPVSELVNTIYWQGYHEQMVPGIFGHPDTGEFSPCINWDDCAESNGIFERQYTSIFPEGARFHIPFRHVVDKPVENGVQFINKLTGKWGVFPRFKGGGYSVGVAGDAEWASERDMPLLNDEDIEGADWQMRHNQMQGSYLAVRYESKNKDNYAGSSALYGQDKSLGGWAWSDWRDSTFDAIRVSKITVKTEDVAAGLTQSERFRDYAKRIHEEVYGRPHHSMTLRLCGLEWATLAPGDYVSVNVDKWMGHWGAINKRVYADTYMKSVMSSTYTDRTNAPWFVTSVHCDWMNCTVTLKLSVPQLYTEEGWSRGLRLDSGPYASHVANEWSEHMDLPLLEQKDVDSDDV